MACSKTKRTGRSTTARPKVTVKVLASERESEIKRSKSSGEMESPSTSASGIVRPIIPFVGCFFDVVIPVSASASDTAGQAKCLQISAQTTVTVRGNTSSELTSTSGRVRACCRLPVANTPVTRPFGATSLSMSLT